MEEKKRFGVDVSHNNGVINWGSARQAVDFAIVRAGYGQGKKDAHFEDNVRGCGESGIPFGIYWFSYANSVDAAILEAKYCLTLIRTMSDLAKKYFKLPIFFDYEYVSKNFAEKNGAKITNEVINSMAAAFLTEIENAGFDGGLYTNYDYYMTVYNELMKSNAIWIARWGQSEPTIENKVIWQNSASGACPGIYGNVDTNFMDEKVYKKYCNKLTETAVEMADKKILNYYHNLALDIINGKYDVGEQRKQLVADIGKDYEAAQMLVNAMLSDMKEN